jgi:flagellar biosynthesis protein
VPEDFLEIRKAVALSFEPQQDSEPLVLACGSGVAAEQIIAAALEAGIPIAQNSDLVSELMKLEVQQPIPPELFEAVAELLAFAFELLGKPFVDERE